MNAIIISIGDELILGQTIDTNSAWLSAQLARVGCAVSAHITVGDDQKAIAQAIRESASKCDFIIITGGIGPTADDLTRQALAQVMDVPLELDERWLAQLHDFFHQRGREMPRMNQIQAMIPRGAELIWNHNGTAAGIHAHFPADIFVMPGVPKEMKAMFEKDVLPLIAAHGGGAGGGVILSSTLHTFGLGESAVAEMLGNLMDRTRNPSVGTTVSQGIVSLRINARFDSKERAEAELAKTEAECRRALGDLIYGQDEQTLAQILSELLKKDPLAQRWAPAVCTAESCTGGLLAKYLTDVPGSSAYFRQGWVTYDNEAKINELNVSKQTLERFGAVSEETVGEMVRGAAARSGAPFALATSGIAGPDGGTPAKPVGTVCFGLSYPRADAPDQLGITTRTFHLFGDREMIRDRACKMAMTMLRFHLLGKPLPF